MIPLESILAEITHKLDVLPSEVIGPSKSKTVSQARKWFIRTAVEFGHTQSAIADYINRQQTYVSRVCNESP